MEFVGIAKFKIKSEFTDTQMVKAEKEIRKALETQKGFISRELGKFEDGFWIVTIKWDSNENGSKWTENSKKFESVQRQHSMIDFSTMRMEFYQNQLINYRTLVLQGWPWRPNLPIKPRNRHRAHNY